MKMAMHRVKRLILWTGCFITVSGIWISCYFQVKHDREQARLTAETTTDNLSKAFEEHVRSTVLQLDSTLLTMRDDYVQHPKYFVDQLAIYKKNLYHDLIIQVSIIDPKGFMVFNEQYMPKVPLDLSDREHFRVHRNSSADFLFISKPVFGRISRRWSIQFTRKIVQRDGSFGGVMVISVDPAFFTSFFRSFNLGDEGVVTLVGMDRVVRARTTAADHPPLHRISVLPPERPFFDPAKPDVGLFRVSSVIDGIDRIWAYRRLHNFPLVVCVGLAEDEVYRTVNSRKRLFLLWSGFFSALLLLGTKVILIFDKQQCRTEASLREANQRLELAAASGGLGIWEWEISTGRLNWDARMLELYGIDPGSFSGTLHEFEKTVHPDDLVQVRQMMKVVVEEGLDLSGEFRILDGGGSVKVIRADGLLIRDAAGRGRMIGLNSDVTKRKEMEKALHDSEEQFRTLCDAAPVGIFRSDGEGKTIYCNPRWEEITGYPAAATVGTCWTGQTHPDDFEEVARLWQQAKMSGRVFSHEHRRFTASGKMIWIRALVNPVFDADGTVLSHVGTLEDITELRHARQDMLKTQKLQSLGVLAGGIAHDFNNILTAIVANVSLARTQLNRPEMAALRLENAEKGIARATDLTKQLLTFAKGGTPVKKTIKVNALVEEAGRFVLHGSKANCRFELAADTWPVEADEGQISQVVHNLMLNAVQAMSGGGTVTVRTGNVRSSLGARLVTISVTDTGVGIAEDNLQAIFDPYFTTKVQGNGLGLATCYSIVKKHGGTITVSSTEGAGAVFTVSLPASEGEVEAAARNDAQLVKGTGRVLVMDDDEEIRTVARDILEELGYTVELAEDGGRAVELYRQRQSEGRPFFAVILDLTIPGGMGGKETMDRLRELEPDVKAVVSSGYSNDTVMANYRDHGFKAVLSKPYLAEEMSKVLVGLTG